MHLAAVERRLLPRPTDPAQPADYDWWTIQPSPVARSCFSSD